MLVTSVVLRPKRGTLAAAVAEYADASDVFSLGTGFSILIDNPGTASDTLDGFVGQMMVEAASAAAVVGASSIRNAAIIENTIAGEAARFPFAYALMVAETATATSTQGSAAGPSILAAAIVESATAADAVVAPTHIAPGASAVLEGVFVDPRLPSSLLGTDVLDSGPIIVLAAGGSFDGSDTDPITPSSGIPLVPPTGPVDGGTGTYTVPADWNNASNSIECIGGGAGGIGAGVIWAHGGYGGGGGAYSKISNVTLTPGAIINFHVGEGGAWNADGGDTWCISSSTVYAQGGKGATGGQTSAGIGTVKYNGGNGGVGGSGGLPDYYGAGGGGGAAGPNGAGLAGGTGLGASGGGGGGGSGGAVGGTATGSPSLGYAGGGGTGGNSYLGTGGGTGGTDATTVAVYGAAGTNGGGGGGGTGAVFGGAGYYGTGGKGGNGREWGKNIGAGGGGGGAGENTTGGHGGYYGGGGGGAASSSGPPSSGGAGASGIIIIRYNP